MILMHVLCFQRVDERFKMREKSSMFKNQNCTLKEAKKLYGLWDNVYNHNAVKNLDPASRWDPSKMAEEKKKKKEVEKESSEEETDEEDDGEPKLDADGNPIGKERKMKSPELELGNKILYNQLESIEYKKNKLQNFHFDPKIQS